MPTITQDLADILKGVQRPGDFFTTGRSDFAPRLEVSGVGLIALPLLAAQAEQLVAVAEQAPYGRGADTLIDTEVRWTWQIGVDRVRIGGRHWDQDLADIVARSATGLGVLEPVTAALYKLLVYDTGSFFVSHRDTEKAPGMFATLVVVLPSVYSGGELCIHHREREVCLDLVSPEPSEVAFAAFYADCRHEVRPITAGCRLVLIYNLIRQGQGRLPEPPAYETEVDRVSELLRRWAAEPSGDDSAPDKLIYPLEHAYTPAEIGFPALKGSDAAVSSVLLAAAGQANCELHLALLAITESGSAEYNGSWPRSRRHSEPDDDDFEVIEVCEYSCTLSGWQTPDGSRAELAELSFDDEELCPPGALKDAEPDEQHFFEATGNEGASFERSYQRAALVLWPQAGKLKVIAGAGRAVSLPYLAALTGRWVPNGEDKESKGSPLWNDAHQLARLMIARREDWSTSGGASPGASEGAAALLTTRRLTTACLDHLAQRIAEPLVAPADFARASHIDCRCAHCRELSAFLADPLRAVWTFKAVQADRSHVEHSIRRHDCDVRHETLRHGSPHSLVCTKTQASFERRVVQRKKDLDDRERLRQPAEQ